MTTTMMIMIIMTVTKGIGETNVESEMEAVVIIAVVVVATNCKLIKGSNNAFLLFSVYVEYICTCVEIMK